MRIEYELTPQDLFAFQWRAAYRSAAARRTRRRAILLLFVAFALTAVLPTIGRGVFAVPLISWIFLGVVFPIMAGLYLLIVRWLVRRAIWAHVSREKPEKGQLGRHRVELTDGELIESTAVGESRTSWAGVDRIEEDADYVYVYTGASTAHLVPKRALGAAQPEAFIALARSRTSGGP